ncbi:hypothetical protein ACFL4L_00790 [bacterium]
MKRILLIAAGFLLIGFFFDASIADDDVADLIIWNGKIITVDAEEAIAQAVAMKDSLILAVGSNAEIQALQGPDTEMRNLNGRTP